MATPSSMLPLGALLPAIPLTDAVGGELVDVNALAAGKHDTMMMCTLTASGTYTKQKSSNASASGVNVLLPSDPGNPP